MLLFRNPNGVQFRSPGQAQRRPGSSRPQDPNPNGGRTLTVANLLKGLKQESSKWIGTKDESLRDFYWQEGYGAFSTIPDRLSALRRYIAEQEEHHKKESFKNEYRRLLKAYNVEYDERYVWD
jgi:hypothetical protein